MLLFLFVGAYPKNDRGLQSSQKEDQKSPTDSKAGPRITKKDIRGRCSSRSVSGICPHLPAFHPISVYSRAFAVQEIA